MSDSIPMPNTPATGEEMSTAETLTGIFFEPSRTFEALRARPRFLVAGLILLALACIVTVVLYMRVDMSQFIRDRIERSPNAAQLTEEQKEMQARIGKNIGAAVIPVSIPVTIAGGAALYLLGVMLFGRSITYKKSLAVWVYSSIPPSVVGALIAVLVLFLKSPDSVDPEYMVATNPAALLGEDTSRLLVAVLKQFDLLRFYGMFLAALGLRKVTKLSSGQAWGVVIALWAIGALLSIASAAIFGR
jgi:hypothetical protein